MVEALDYPAACERVCDDLCGCLVSQLLERDAIGVGNVDDDLPLPVGQRFRDIGVGLETDGQKDDIRLDRVCKGSWPDRGPYSGGLRCEALRIASGRY